MESENQMRQDEGLQLMLAEMARKCADALASMDGNRPVAGQIAESLQSMGGGGSMRWMARITSMPQSNRSPGTSVSIAVPRWLRMSRLNRYWMRRQRRSPTLPLSRS